MPNAVRLSKMFGEEGRFQVFTRHGHSIEEMTPPITNLLVKKWGVDGSIAIGSQEYELLPEIAEAYSLAPLGTPMILKNTYDSFQYTDLEEVLRQEGIKRVIICGVMTDCCVDTTARSAFCKGFETWIISDATSSVNNKQHEMGLSVFRFAFGDVLTTEEAIAALRGEDLLGSSSPVLIDALAPLLGD